MNRAALLATELRLLTRQLAEGAVPTPSLLLGLRNASVRLDDLADEFEILLRLAKLPSYGAVAARPEAEA